MRGAPKWRALLALQLAGVCWLAFDPRPPAAADTLGDKANHVLAFAVMAFSARRAGPGAPAWPAAAALLAFGVFIEAVQAFIPGRSAEWRDLLADAAGVAVGLALHRFVPPRP